MKPTIWVPPENNPELTRAILRLEEIRFEIRKLNLRISRTKAEIQTLYYRRELLFNNINNLRSNNTPIVSIIEFKKILADIKRVSRAIADQQIFLDYDKENLHKMLELERIIEREIEDLSRTCTILLFKNARSKN